MAQESDDRSSFMDALDKSEQIATTVGLIASGVIFAAGVAGLLFVMIHVAGADPPSFGSHREWLYGAIACLAVAGWAFGWGTSLYARRRNASAGALQEGVLTPRIQIGPGGFSIEVGSPRRQDSVAAKPATWTWSFNSMPAPIKTLKLSEAQVAAADAEAQNGVEWDAVCRKIAPEYAALNGFEQNIYRQAVQASVEDRRRNRE